MHRIKQAFMFFLDHKTVLSLLFLQGILLDAWDTMLEHIDMVLILAKGNKYLINKCKN